MIVPYFRPNLGDSEKNAVIRAIESGWISTGPCVAKLESQFSDFLNLDSTEGANAVSSATAGLHLALEAVNADEETTVFLPTMTFTATAEVVRYSNSRIVLIDSSSDNPNMDIDLLFRRIDEIQPKRAVVIPVHFGGYPVDMDVLLSGVHESVQIIEDAAHAFPSRINGKFVGQFDTAATVFSFYANKTMTTGEGGMVTSNRPDIARRIRLMKSHGIDRIAFDRFQGSRKRAWEYDVVEAGFKYNMSDILASIGNVQFERSTSMQLERESIAQRYSKAFENLPCGIPAEPINGIVSTRHIYSIEINETFSKTRDAVMEELNSKGIQTSLHYIPLHRMTYWSGYLGVTPKHFPHAEQRFRRTISLPIFPGMKDSEVDYVIECVVDALR